MDEFLVNRYEVVERISSIKSTKERHSLPVATVYKTQTYTSQDKLNISCSLCESNHSIRLCPEFRKFSSQERIDFVYKNKICNNCLSPTHAKNNCKSKNTFLSCKKKHHTLQHLQLQNPIHNSTTMNHNENSQPDTNSKLPKSAQSNTVIKHSNEQPSSSSKIRYSQVHANFSSNSHTILLRTALVQIEHQCNLFTVRALIDPGSQRTFASRL